MVHVAAQISQVDVDVSIVVADDTPWKDSAVTAAVMLLLVCLIYRFSYTETMKTMIDLDEEALGRAARELGTKTKKETVNAALSFVAARRNRIERILDDPYALGVGPDITDPAVMREARR